MDLPIKKGATVSVLGLGRSGMAVISYFARRGVSLYAFDDGAVSDEKKAYLASLGVPLFTHGKGELRGEYVFRAPAVRPDTPRLVRAALRGAYVLTEAEYVMLLSPSRVFAVTGSDGKTTTSSYLADLLSHTGRRIHLGGNIGRCLLPLLDDMTEHDFCVMELSSFQLMACSAPIHTGAITNLTENHLNWHTDMAEYAAAKERLLQLSARRVLRGGLFEGWDAVRFSSCGTGDYTLKGHTLYGRGVALCHRSDLCLSGIHNVENLLAAAACAEEYVTPWQVKETARRFRGAAHRMEWVRTVAGVRFYNSSIDTTPARTAVTVNALKDMGGRILLLCGGKDKGLSFAPLAELIRQTKARVYLFGEAEEKIASTLRAHGISYTSSGSMQNAALTAYGDAKGGDAVLLSPACTSFDAFADFEARGEAFRYLVGKIKEK